MLRHEDVKQVITNNSNRIIKEYIYRESNMAMTYDELKVYLEKMNLSYNETVNDDNKIKLLGVWSESGEEDEKPETVIIELQENGKFLRLFEPQRYSLKDCEHTEKVLQTLLKMNYEMKMLTWEYNPNNCEVRASVEIPIEDGTLTFNQFSRALNSLSQMMDTSHHRIKQVMATGEESV